MRASDRFTTTTWRPASADLAARGELPHRIACARALLARCTACPRSCGARRDLDERGDCGVGKRALVASAGPHFGEEACLVGRHGSGTVFFSLCNLHCVFCQNWELSQHPSGRPCTPAEIADLALQLQDRGCHNLNLVTPEHVVPQVVEALAVAVEAGLRVPVVYNTSGYDSVDSLRLLEGLVDIYMPDFKVWRSETAARYCAAADYPECARRALREMHRQVGPLVMDEAGLAVRGVLVRHLVLPGRSDESAAILRWLARELSPDTFVNIMAQYRPCHLVGTRGPDGRRRFPELDRRPTAEEMSQAVSAAHEAGLRRLTRDGAR